MNVSKKIVKSVMAFFLSFPIFTVFIYTNQLMNGVYTAKTFYFYFVISLITVCCAVLIGVKGNLKITIDKIDIILSLFFLYSIVRLLLTPNIPLGNTRLITHTFIITLYILLKYSLYSSKVRINTVLLLFLTVGMGQAIHGLLQFYKIIPIPYNIGGFRVFGNFGNPAPYGSFLSPFVPVSLGIYLLWDGKGKMDNFLKNFALLCFLICVLILPATQSRSSWLGALGGSLLVLNYRYELLKKAHQFLNRTWKQFVSIIMLVLLLFAGSLQDWLVYVIQG